MHPEALQQLVANMVAEVKRLNKVIDDFELENRKLREKFSGILHEMRQEINEVKVENAKYSGIKDTYDQVRKLLVAGVWSSIIGGCILLVEWWRGK